MSSSSYVKVSEKFSSGLLALSSIYFLCYFICYLAFNNTMPSYYIFFTNIYSCGLLFGLIFGASAQCYIRSKVVFQDYIRSPKTRFIIEAIISMAMFFTVVCALLTIVRLHFLSVIVTSINSTF